MGICLIAVMSAADLGNLLLLILQVAFALGMVIFVHELGHFAVAKWCGVKCEKFYLGFDIYGLKLFKYQWGETEYGIGILPLGGYVKMLGQDDNPSRAADERERSQLKSEDGAPAAGAPLDPRSYLAKSVPQRMAIISAGVIMNVIFAFICAVAAYSLGVTDTACGVSSVIPGQTAWRADVRPGDRILKIDGTPTARFRDLRSAVALGNLQDGIDFTIERAGDSEPRVINLKPDTTTNPLVPTIGVIEPFANKLAKNPVVEAASPASRAGFKAGDELVSVDDVPIDSAAQFESQMVAKVDQPVRITVRRQGEGKDAAPEELTLEVAPRPMRDLGLQMTLGEVTAVQNDSPAQAAGIEPGDVIQTIDGQAPGDPVRLPDTLRKRAGETIKLVVLRKNEAGQAEPIEKEITLRERNAAEEAKLPNNPISIPSLGLAYQVIAKVAEVAPDGPAAQAELKVDGHVAAKSQLAPGDEIVKAAFKLPEVSEEVKNDKSLARVESAGEMEFSDEKLNWPVFMTLLQVLPEGTEVTLTLKDKRQMTLTAVNADDWYYYDRGLMFAPELTVVKADSFAEAVKLGGRETVDSLLMVYRFLQRLVVGQISVKALGGPVTIARAAGMEASEGLSRLLLFLTMLSANLAVINFLPIPLLDGGHMVFLALEGIFRRPVSEKVQIAFHYVGFVFIISLMLFVLGLDLRIIPRM